jgi:hypothetical protein
MPGVQLDISSLFNLTSLLLLLASTAAGIVIGAMPGLTATMGVSLLVSTTLGLGPANALVVMIGVFLGGIYGGSRSAILLNVPGTPSSAATALEGFPLTRQGRGIEAGVMVTSASAMGGIVGLVILMLLAKPISRAAMLIGYWEFFWLGMFGVVICGSMTAERPYKGLISGMAGLFISCIGIDGIFGGVRFSFGVSGLKAGISLVPAMVGLFGLSEAIAALTDPESHAISNLKKVTIGEFLHYVKQSFVMLKDNIKLFFMSSVIGTMIGAVPGTGEDIASWVAYDTARRKSKHKELFGKGSWEGLIASETANNACTGGVFIPMLTLGVAGDAVSAIIMGGLQLHGYQTGPNFMTDNPNFIYFLAALLLLTNIVMFMEGVVITPALGKILQIRVGIIMPIVVVLSVIGAYAASIRTFDITIMVIFGFIGFLLKKLRISPAPMALGIILGGLIELNYRRGLMAGKYDVSLFFTRPVAAVLALLLVFFVVWPIIRNSKRAKEEQ